MQAESIRPKIACVQLDSKHADIPANIAQIEAITSHLEAGELDLVVLPEMALTGYVFDSLQAIKPYIERPFESPPQSPSLQLAIKLARRLQAHVIIGLPFYATSRESEAGSSAAIAAPFDARPASAKIKENLTTDGSGPYNGALVVDSKGQIVHVFRKHFLFETDENWANQGPGFEVIHLPRLGKICVAICMDLNPWKFEAEESTCELATFCKEQDVDGLVVLMAWLRSRAADTREADSEEVASFSVINYWAMRLRPLFTTGNRPNGSSTATASVQSLAPLSRRRYFVAANRSGTEEAITFAGSSCALRLESQQAPVLLGRLGEKAGVLTLSM